MALISSADGIGEYRSEGNAFVYVGRDSGRIITVPGYPTRRIAELADREISKIFV